MQKTEVMYNRATVITDLRYLSYPVIFVLLIFSLLMAGCSDDENEENLLLRMFRIIARL